MSEPWREYESETGNTSDDLEPYVKWLEKRHEKSEASRLALESLTPGGSEYYCDAKRCLDYVRERLQETHELKKGRVLLNRKLEETQVVLSQAMYAMESIYAEYMALHPNHTTNLPCFDHVMKLVSDTRKMENALKGK